MAQSYVIRLNEDIKDDVARSFVEENHPGGNAGRGFYTDGAQLWEVEPTRAWNPWPDGRDVVAIRFLFSDDCRCSGVPEDSTDWESAEDYDTWAAAYQIAHPDEDDPLDPWAVVAWVRETPAYAAALTQFEQEYEDNAVLYALGELAPAVRVDIDDDGYQDVVRLDE